MIGENQGFATHYRCWTTPMRFRIATFNAENLFQRFDFPDHKSQFAQTRAVDPELAALDGELDEDGLKFDLTAKALAQTRADILCLQEVENMQALADFDRDYLRYQTGSAYDHKILIEGNDGRGIDVALLARSATREGIPITIASVTSHAHLTYADLDLMTEDLIGLKERPEERVFRRDCLMVELNVGTEKLTVIVLHLKSMGTDNPDVDGRTVTMPVRDAEARAIKKILLNRFGPKIGQSNWLICGDLNDYLTRLEVRQPTGTNAEFELVHETNCGFWPLVEDKFSTNLVERRPSDNQWTLFHSKAPFEHHLVQLDYILASPKIAQRNPSAVPEIVRNGQPYRVILPEGQQVDRYQGTGWDRPKASDHCPVVVSLDID